MIADCAQYHEGLRIGAPSNVSEAAVCARRGPGFVSLSLLEPGREDMEQVRAAFDLPASAVEDGLESHQRPRLEDYGDCVLAVVKSVHYDQATSRVDMGEIDVFIGASYAITVARSDSETNVGAHKRLDDHPAIGTLGPMSVLWALLDTVIDNAEQVVDMLGDQAEDIEQIVFDGDLDQSQAIFLHRRRVDRLIRGLHPVLPVLDTLERGEPVDTPPGLRPFLSDVSDHARTITEELNQLASRLDGLLNANLARVTVRQNVIVQKVSAWAAIAAAPTIITGIYGMNFRYFPELDWRLGYPLAIVLMITAVLVLRWNFRRIGWL